MAPIASPTRVVSFPTKGATHPHPPASYCSEAQLDALSPTIVDGAEAKLTPALRPGPGPAVNLSEVDEVLYDKAVRSTIIVKGVSKESGEGSFLRPKTIAAVFNEATLANIIHNSQTRIDHEGQKKIYAGFFQKILSVLASVDKLECIGDFVAVGLCDSQLPLSSQGRILVSRRNTSKFDISGLGWKKRDIQNFCNNQWPALSPFFHMPGGQILHYMFEKDVILPFSEKEALDPNGGEDSDFEDEFNDGDAQTKILGGGGFADVFRVKIHPDFNELGNFPLCHKSKSFALKRLRQNTPKIFMQEVQVLKRLSGRHPNLIPLLLTFEQDLDGGAFHFLFPWASGDCRTLWTRQDTNVYHCRWLVQQCYGLVDALAEVHFDKEQHTKDPDDPAKQVKKYARHGDIKPDNILLFDEYEDVEKLGPKLILADFGFGRFHRQWSRSTRDPRKTPKSPTYKAPEFELKDGKITRRSDIWSLGCTFLELVTWYLLGERAVEIEFPDEREAVEIVGRPDDRAVSDTFFQVDARQAVGRLKPGVTSWIRKLHESPRCSRALHELLEYVEKHMLEIEQKDRVGSRAAAEFLKKKLNDNPRANSKYWMEGSKCRCSRPKKIHFKH